MLNSRISDAAANAEANALAALMDNGFLRLYDGNQPSDANLPVTDQTLLAELSFSSPAFNEASEGLLAANDIAADRDAKATGTPTWFRCVQADGKTAVLDGSVGTSGCNLNLKASTIQQHAQVSLSGFSYRVTE